MKGKRKRNGQVEKREKQAFRKSPEDREQAYLEFPWEFGHPERDTIAGKEHKRAVITLVERLSKAIITLKPYGKTAKAIEVRLKKGLNGIPGNIFKSITFDYGKEFSNWKNISNSEDISIFFADPGCPSQRGLNGHSNGLLRRDGLAKKPDFRDLNEWDIV